MLDNPRAARVRRVASLADKRARSETGLALLEGPQVVGEAATSRADLLDEVFATEDARTRHPTLFAALADADVPVETVTDAVLAAMADTVSPQGVVAVARQAPVALRDVFAAARLGVILDEVRDPGNAGTILRTADAAGADAVVLTAGSVDLYNPKVVRATTGSLFHLSVSTGASLDAAVERAKQAGCTVLAADMAGEPLTALGGALGDPTVWLFGNEAHGISPVARALADRVVAVPIYGAAESLNLASAAAVCIYASAFAQRA